MQTLTIRASGSRTLVTIQAEEYVDLMFTLDKLNITFSSRVLDDIIALAYRERQVIGADDSVLFEEMEDGSVEAGFFIGSKLVITKLACDVYKLTIRSI